MADGDRILDTFDPELHRGQVGAFLGGMGSGKSWGFMGVMSKAQHCGVPVLHMKPLKDFRDNELDDSGTSGKGFSRSRGCSGASLPAERMYKDGKDLYDQVTRLESETHQRIRLIGIDEFQVDPLAVIALRRLINDGDRAAVIASLDKDFRAEDFTHVRELVRMALATGSQNIDRMKSHCQAVKGGRQCGRPAALSARVYESPSKPWTTEQHKVSFTRNGNGDAREFFWAPYTDPTQLIEGTGNPITGEIPEYFSVCTNCYVPPPGAGEVLRVQGLVREAPGYTKTEILERLRKDSAFPDHLGGVVDFLLKEGRVREFEHKGRVGIIPYD